MGPGNDKPGGGNVKIYLRLKPTPETSPLVVTDTTAHTVTFEVPKNNRFGLFVNNALDRFGFAFDGILTEDAGQDEVFERVALKPVLGALDGFNGTVFAYGQTGSGKTFTITGGVEKYAERGIVPRAISRLFSEIRKRVDSSTYEVTVTYVEVYNDQAYDLLCDYRDTNTAVGHTTTGGDQNLPAGSNAFGTGSTWTGAQKSFGTSTSGTNSGTAKNSSTTTPPSQSTSGGIDCAVSLPKVTLLEDDDGVVHARGCSVHRASSEEDALNLLFLGDVNRAVAETPMNLASSRSHCVFTMNVSRREVGSEVVRKGKMHLVDLAGSERVEKTGAASDASTTREARHINLSLHALEKVVVALSDKTEHVPYRDSVMTMLLKDSLGGNCFTAMVATVSPTTRHVLESISTCRFAMRIKSVTNCLQVNEETDPRLVIKRLRLENKTLREEVKLLRGDNDGGRDTLTESEIAKVRNEVETFCGTSFGTSDTAAGTSNAATTSIDFGASLLKINAAMLVFKDMVLLARGSEAKNPVPNESDSKKETQRVSPSLETLRDETKRLAKVVSQRDDEIKVLVSLLDENKKSGGALTRPPGTTESYLPSTSLDRSEYRSSSGHDAETYLSSNALGRSAFTDSSTSLDRSAFSDKATAFVAFKARYPKRAAIEENKNVLRQKYAAAKSLGEDVNARRAAVANLKKEVLALRARRAFLETAALDGVDDTDDDSDCVSTSKQSRNSEQTLFNAIDSEKRLYKAAFDKLRDLKSEIENLQLRLERGRRAMGDAFGLFWGCSSGGDVARESTGTGDGCVSCTRDSTGDGSVSCTRDSTGDGTLTSPDIPRNYSPFPKKEISESEKENAQAAKAFAPTGNKQADADIAAFYAARSRLLRRGNSRGSK